MENHCEQIRQYVSALEIVDTHEHMPAREADRPQEVDILGEYLGHYFSSDLVSAGLTGEQLAFVRDSQKPLAKRWRLVEPYWNAARNTGYGRALDIAARDIHGFARIDGKTIAGLNEAFMAARRAGGVYRKVLKKMSKIRASILDSNLDCDRRFFRSTVRLDDFVTVCDRAQLDALAARAGMKAIHSLGDLEAACERTLDDAIGRGAACLKSGLAYCRTLRYEKTGAAEAEAQFNAIYAAENFASPCGAMRKLQDYMMHHVCRLADARGLTFQIHTGIQEGNGNYIYHSDPALLSNLFLEYPNVKFDVFHIGYPYQQTLSVLAKNFRNVFIDFCWMHIISPTAAVNAMVEYLDAVPANKISGFGGDYCFVDGVYGHQIIARENITRSLATKIDQGVLGLDRAKELAGMILRDNPAALFGLSESKSRAGARRKKKSPRAR